MAIAPETFKAGMRRLVASVSLITTGGPAGPTAGLTATAVCSVAAEPPTLLCCINRSTASYGAILEARLFAVNVLSLEDRELADHFAGRLPAARKFAQGRWVRGVTGAPLLETALASFDCALDRHVEVGTHGILFGRIEEVRVSQGRIRPLIYAHAGYGGFTGLEAAGGGSDLLWNPDDSAAGP